MLRHWQHRSALRSSSLLFSLSRLLLNFALSLELGIRGPAWPMPEDEEMESDLLVGIWCRGEEMETIKEIMEEVCAVGLWWWKEDERCCAVVVLYRVFGCRQLNAPRTKRRLLLFAATRHPRGCTRIQNDKSRF